MSDDYEIVEPMKDTDIIRVTWGEIRGYKEALSAATVRAEAAEAIVSRLPKTADGVPVVPGMEVFGGWEGTGIVASVMPYGYRVTQPGGLFFRDFSDSWSTREAAEKAKADHA